METDISSVIFHLIGLGFLLSLSAFFSGSEIALFSLSKSQVDRLQEINSRVNKLVVKLLNDPHRLLITILVGNTLVNTASASLVAFYATTLFGDKGIGLAIGLTTILLLIFGEIIPKIIAVQNSEVLSKIVSYPLDSFSKIIYPVKVILEFITDKLIKFLSRNIQAIDDRITPEELKTAVYIAEEEGSIKQQEKEIITTIFDLKNITAAEIMVPRTEIICADDGMTLQELFNIARDSKHSRIPIYKDDIDNIYGIAYMRDFPLLRKYELNRITIQEFLSSYGNEEILIRKPFFAPETRTAIGLLQDFREQRVQIAILLDEYGGTAGLVTMADLVNELVGEFTGSYDSATYKFRFIDEFTTIVPGRTSIRNVNKKLDLDLPAEEDVDTIGGYVISLLGHIPQQGEIISDSNLEFEIVSMKDRSINEVIIRKNKDISERGQD